MDINQIINYLSSNKYLKYLPLLILFVLIFIITFVVTFKSKKQTGYNYNVKSSKTINDLNKEKYINKFYLPKINIKIDKFKKNIILPEEIDIKDYSKVIKKNILDRKYFSKKNKFDKELTKYLFEE